MKSKKFVWVLALVFALSLVVAGCGGGKNGDKESPKQGETPKQQAQEVKFPTKPITIVTGSSPGAPIDVMARLLAKLGEKTLGVPISVLNKVGGSGTIALSYNQTQPADGYTVNTEATGITSILQMAGSPYTYKDFEYVIRVQMDPFALYVAKDSPYKTLDDFLKAAKSKKIRVGGYGKGSPHNIITYDLGKKAGVEFEWVPFNSGNDAIMNVMGGHLDAAMSNISAYASKKGEVRVLAVSSDERVNFAPEVPTFKELGYPELTRYHWRGLIVKKGTPKEIIQKLHDGFKKAMEDPEWKKYMESSGMLDGYLPPDKFKEAVYAQADNDLKVLKEMGLLK